MPPPRGSEDVPIPFPPCLRCFFFFFFNPSHNPYRQSHDQVCSPKTKYQESEPSRERPRRTFNVGVEGRKGVRLEPATLLGYETDRSRVANDSSCIETKRRNLKARIQSTPCRTSLDQERRGDANSTGCPATLDEMTCSLGRVR